jgi:hypothetical protein
LHRSRRLLLDIGAGDGNVTSKLAPLFSHVYATEFCAVMRWRLLMRRYTYDDRPFVGPSHPLIRLLGINEWQAFAPKSETHSGNQDDLHVVIEPRRQYDVISCLNVLDRWVCAAILVVC